MARDTEIVDVLVPQFIAAGANKLVPGNFLLCFGRIIDYPLDCAWGAYNWLWLLQPVFNIQQRIPRCKKTRIPSLVLQYCSPCLKTLSGLDTIEPTRDTGRFIQQHIHTKMDRNLKFFFNMWMITSWMTIRLEAATV